MPDYSADKLYVIEVTEQRISEDVKRLVFRTTRGEFDAVLHGSSRTGKGIIMLGGDRAGVDSPSDVYLNLASRLMEEGITSLRLSFRDSEDCVQCGIDTLAALQYLDDESVGDVLLLGWSFGGAVALAAGSLARNVRGVAVISTLDDVDCCYKRLGPKPVLIVHGEIDDISPVEWPKRIYDRLTGPRRLIIYPGAGHDLREVREQLVSDIRDWVTGILANPREAD
ncbi:MAG: dienelactone hydrolase family protein [Armatimonadota bacterium]|nr:dienelactone hydrolase family protein [bacterium]